MRLQEGCIKLNSDGACKDRGEIAGCEGLFHDSNNRWFKGYTEKIDMCDVLQVEMRVLYLGLGMARREHFSQLRV